MALLHYHGLNVVTVGLPGGGHVQLLPGVNEVEDSQFEMVKIHPHFKARVKDKKIIILSQQTANGKQTVEEMLSYIPNVFDVKLLKKIIKTDGREKVVDAAQEQLTKISNPKKNQEQQENEHFS